jgi:hypothetical protein
VSWKLVDGLFWLIQAITHAVITILMFHEKRFQAVAHPLSLRIYWVANFIVYCHWDCTFDHCRRTPFPFDVLLFLAAIIGSKLDSFFFFKHIYIYIYILRVPKFAPKDFLRHVHTRGMMGIRTSDFRFIRRGPSRLNYILFGTSITIYYTCTIVT